VKIGFETASSLRGLREPSLSLLMEGEVARMKRMTQYFFQ